MSTGDERYGPRDPEGDDTPPDPEPTDRADVGGPDHPADKADRADTTDPADTADAADAADTAEDLPERRPWNAAGWIGSVACTLAFLTSLAVGWSGSMMLAALGLAFCITTLVRVYRGRATNRLAALIGIALAVGTFVLQGVWSAQAGECRPLLNDRKAYTECYNERAGLF